MTSTRGTLGTAVRLLVRTVGELLITVGVLIGLFLLWQLWWTDVVAERDQAQQVAALTEHFEAVATGEISTAPDAPDAPDIPDASAMADPPPSGDAFAVIHIPRFGSDFARPVIEDTGLDVLERGVGHYAGTAMPGEVGNFAIAGHRTTYGKPFNQIHELESGDRVVIETATAYSVYLVDDHAIVSPADVHVIAPVPGEPGAEPTEGWLTMTSCHPMFSARERYVVHARLSETIPRGDAGLTEILAAA